MSICCYLFIIKCNKTEKRLLVFKNTSLKKKSIVTAKLPLPKSVNTNFSCFRSVINTHARVLTAQRLTASSWLGSPPLVNLYLRASHCLMGIRPSAQLWVWTCSNSNWSLFPAWSLLRDWAPSTTFPPSPSSSLSHWADPIGQKIASTVTSASACYELKMPAFCINWKLITYQISGNECIRID